VARRRTEFGIRITLGATHRDVLGLSLGKTIVMTASGIAMGLAIAAAVTRYLDALLFGITPLDPLTFLATPGVLVLVALVASYLPARRATKLDPMTTLRCE
jgi:putative ABC transport system permease protein